VKRNMTNGHRCPESRTPDGRFAPGSSGKPRKPTQRRSPVPRSPRGSRSSRKQALEGPRWSVLGCNRRVNGHGLCRGHREDPTRTIRVPRAKRDRVLAWGRLIKAIDPPAL
jgi:hypothetical protein